MTGTVRQWQSGTCVPGQVTAESVEPRWEALGHRLQEERGGRHLGSGASASRAAEAGARGGLLVLLEGVGRRRVVGNARGRGRRRLLPRRRHPSLSGHAGPSLAAGFADDGSDVHAVHESCRSHASTRTTARGQRRHQLAVLSAVPGRVQWCEGWLHESFTAWAGKSWVAAAAIVLAAATFATVAANTTFQIPQVEPAEQSQELVNDAVAPEEMAKMAAGKTAGKSILKRPASSQAVASASGAKAKPASKAKAKAAAKASGKQKASSFTTAKKGWKVETRFRPDGSHDKYYIAPDKKQFRTRHQAEAYGFSG